MNRQINEIIVIKKAFLVILNQPSLSMFLLTTIPIIYYTIFWHYSQRKAVIVHVTVVGEVMPFYVDESIENH